MKFMKFTVLFIFVVSLFFVLFCQSKPTEGVQEAETGKIDFDARAEHVVKEFRELIYYNFNNDKWDRLGLLFEQQGAVLLMGEDEITGQEAIKALFMKFDGRTLTIPDASLVISPIREIEAVINGYKVDKYWNVKFIMKFEESAGEKVLRNADVQCNMLLFHREICWP